jgi:hypothetical protein
MSSFERDQGNLAAMKLIERVSSALNTRSWIWGGFVTDIHLGRILREHHDLDYLTLNLHSLKGKFEEVFAGCGWQTEHLENGDLRLRKDNVKVHLGHVELGEVARWTHNGDKGSLLFPVSWLSGDTTEFCGIDLHVIAPELQYVLKEHPEFLNPDWRIRAHDILEMEYLRDVLLKKGLDVGLLYKLVTSM